MCRCFMTPLAAWTVPVCAAGVCWVPVCTTSWLGEVNLKARVDLWLPAALWGWCRLEPAFFPMLLLQSTAGALEAAGKAPSSALRGPHAAAAVV